MKSTATFSSAPTYLGVDLTDRHAKKPRPVDVCGLWPIDQGVFEASFWTWEWPPIDPLVSGDAEAEIRAARCSMLDAPQALALSGRKERACERACHAPGKTPDCIPALERPFGGFVRSSVEFFDVLHRCGIAVSPPGFVGGASEYYPGHAWPRLIGRRLPKKNTPEGRRTRRVLLSTLGVRKLPDLPTHDQNDACLGAILAAAADGQVRGLEVVGFGDPLTTTPDGGLREGPIATLSPDTQLSRHLADAITLESKNLSPQEPVRQQRSRVSRSAQPIVAAPPGAAEPLFHELLCRAANGAPAVCTYVYAYTRIFGKTPSPWLPSNAGEVIAAAASTSTARLPGLGWVQLDTFIVAAETGRPGTGHWDSASYKPDDWDGVFGVAELLR